MTLTEFKYWLEGYEESFELQRPDAVQWKKIKEKLESVVPVKPTSSKAIPATSIHDYQQPYKVWY